LSKEGVFGVQGTSVLEHIQENMELEDDSDRRDLAIDLEYFKKSMTDAGYDLSDLGIAGLTNNTDFTKLTDDEIVRIAGEVSTIASNQKYYEEQLPTPEEKEAQEKDDAHRAEVAQYTGYDTHAIAATEDSDVLKYFNSGSMLEQTQMWADRYGIDMSQYSGIYSSDVETS
jgi:hypothetical protein